MTSLDKDGFTVSAIGNQTQSARLTNPTYSLSKCSRGQRGKNFISEEHARAGALCRESPGPVYDLPSTLGSGPKMSFSKGAQRVYGKDKHFNSKYNEPSVDCIEAQIDSQPFKYERDKTMLFGTEGKGQLKNATILKSHSAALVGRISPGPANYGPAGGPDVGPTRKSLAHAVRFGAKTKAVGSMISQTPAEVGPGLYPRKDVAMGNQHLSNRRTQGCNTFSKAPKFGRAKDARGQPIIELDVATSAFGKQVDGRKKSEPGIGFGTSTRDNAGRMQRCMTNADEGPKSNMPRSHLSHPTLPSEKIVMRSGIG